MGRDLAIDLGSANTLVYRQGDGIVFDEPTVVALHGGSGEVVAMGEEAWQMLGGDSGNVLAVRPLREGAMTEFDVTQRMLAVVLQRVGVTRFPKPRVLVLGPTDDDDVGTAREARLELTVAADGRVPDGVPIHVKLDTGMGRWGLAELPASPARKLGICRDTVRRWLRAGWLTARRDADGHHVIWADAGELGRLRELRQLPRDWAHRARLAQLIKPGPRPAR